MAASRQLEFNFTGDTDDLDRAFAKVSAEAEAQSKQIAVLERRLDSYEKQLKKTAATQDKQVDSTKRVTATAAASGATTNGWLSSLIAATLALAPAAAAAGVSFGAFAAFAAPSIIKVVSAQGDLVASWDTLDESQKVSAQLTKDLTDKYQDLSRSFQPQALQTYNGVVLTANSLMPLLAQQVDKSGFAVQDFGAKVEHLVSGPQMGKLITTAGSYAPQALGQLGDSLVDVGQTGIALATALVPASSTLLTMTRGVLGLANAAAHVNPHLTEMVVTAYLLRAPTNALVGLWGRASGALSGFAGGTERAAQATRTAAIPGGGLFTYTTGMRQVEQETTRASAASRIFGKLASAGPAIFIGAALGLGYLAVRMSQVRTATDGEIDRLTAENKAFGNNIDGRQSLVRALQQQIATQNQLAKTQRDQGQLYPNAKIYEAANATGKLTDSMKSQMGAIRNIQAGQAALAIEFNITGDSANRLATAAGVDMSKGILKGGEVTADARKKITDYRAAVEAATNTTNTISLALDQAGDSALAMKDRMTGLQAALDAEFSPSLAAFQATTQLKQGFKELIPQLEKAKGSMTGSSAASLQLRQSFANQLTAVAQLRAAILQQSGSLDKANASTRGYLPILYAMAGGNKEARAQVDALARTMGFSISQTIVSKQQFLAQAAALGLSKTRANEMWQAYQRLTKATETSSGSLSAYIKRTNDAAAAARLQAIQTGAGTSAQQAYNSRVQQALPVLYALAGNNKAAKAQVDALARATGNATGATNVSRAAFLRAADAMGVGRKKAADLWKQLQAIKSKKVKVDVDAEGHWAVLQSSGTARSGEPRAMGGPIPAHAALGPGGPTSDDVPIWASVGEHMLTAKEVQAAGGHAGVYRLRQAILKGDLRGYKDGGAISLTGGGDPGRVVAAVNRGVDETVNAIARAMAAIWKKFAQSGGSVVAAARSQIGLPYSWGGGGIGGPSTGIGRGAHTYGFDCSGLTEYAWWKGRHIDIGGVTDSQWANSRPIGSPRPGALGFPAGPSVHVMLASNRPGYVIQAPHTGAFVEEVRRSAPMWRWPKGAAEGGPIDRALAADYIKTGRHAVEVAMGQLAGDPGLLVTAFANGGIQAGIAHGPTLIGERGTGGEAYIPLAPSKRKRAEDLMSDVASRFGGAYAARVPAGGSTGGVTHIHHKKVEVMPGARVTIREEADVDLLARKLEFMSSAASL